MVTDRIRKKKIRAHMAATGDTYLRAARAIDGADSSYVRNQWMDSAWSRLLPLAEAMHLEFVIGTATVTGQDGDLADLLGSHPVRKHHAEGVDTALSWLSRDDEDDDTAALRQLAEKAFRTALSAAGREMPTTLGGLAELLAELGVYEHTRGPDGVQRWRAPVDVPAVTDMLQMPADWLEHEDHVQWITVTSAPALRILDRLRDRRQPEHVDTTLRRLASDCDIPLSATRSGLDGLVYRFGIAVQRHGTVLTRGEIAVLPEHARITLIVDWQQVGDAGEDDPLGPDDPDDINDVPENVVWQGAPWQVYRQIAQDPRISREARDLTGYMRFTFKQPTGAEFTTCLSQMAAQQGVSVDAAADSLIDLESAGLLRWSIENQVAEIANLPHQFTTA